MNIIYVLTVPSLSHPFPPTSLGCSYVPLQWKLAIIHPVPKIKTPVGPSDYRPISVVPILSRVVERLAVSTYLYPALMKPPMVAEITDQFAFHPTSSTMAALIDLLQQLTSMLEKNDYVLLVSTDFTMALDSVRHSTLMQKMAVIDLPDNIYNWIANYFEQRGHVTTSSQLSPSSMPVLSRGLSPIFLIFH